MGLIQTKVFLDFDNDLDFTGDDEDITEHVASLIIQRGTDETLNAGSLELIVNDIDGYFEPQNTSGPYGSNLKLGRRVRVSMLPGLMLGEWEDAEISWDTADVDWGEDYAQFYGFINEISPEYRAEETEDPQRSIIVADLLRLLEIRRMTTGTLVDKTTGELIDLVLDNLGWEGLFTLNRSLLDRNTILGGPGASWRATDTGQTTVPYCSWNDTNLATIIREILAAEHGQFYIRKDGWTVFEDRHHRSSSRTSVATLTDENIAELVIGYSDDTLFNHIEVIAHPRTVGDRAVAVFDAIGSGSGHQLNAGDSREYYVSYSDPDTGRTCEIIDMVTPASGTDYIANSAADGTGTDRTSDLTVTFAADDSERYKFTITNSSATTLYLTTLQVRAKALVAYDAVPMTSDDDNSIAEYLQRDLVVDSALCNDPVEAQDYADWLRYQSSTPRYSVKKLVLYDDTWPNAVNIVNREISDRITINSTKHNVSGDFFIDSITIEADAASGRVRCEWMLSSISTDVLFFTLDVDTLDGVAVLGY